MRSISAGDVVRTAEHAPRAEPPQEVADVGDEVLATTVLVVLVGIHVWPIAIDLDREHHLGIGEVDLEHVVADPDLVVVHGQRRPLSAERIGQHHFGRRVACLRAECPTIENSTKHASA